MQSIQFISITPDELQNKITQSIKTELNGFLENYKPKLQNEYLTRQNVADMFDVNLSTIHNWCKSGKLKPLGIGKRVYFLRTDVENSLISIKEIK